MVVLFRILDRDIEHAKLIDTPLVGGMKRPPAWSDCVGRDGAALKSFGKSSSVTRTPPSVKLVVVFLKITVVPRGDAGCGWNDGQVRSFVSLGNFGCKHRQLLNKLKLLQ